MKFKTLFFVLFCTVHSYAIDFNEIVSTFSADKSALQRKFSNHLSDAYFIRFTQFYSDWKVKLETIDFNSLTKEQKVDYVLLRNYIEKSTCFHQLAQKEFDSVKFVAEKAKEIYDFNEKRKSGITPKSSQLAGVFDATEKAFRNEINSIKNTKPFSNWQNADLAAKVIKSLINATEESFAFYNEYNPDFMWWMQQPHQKLMKTLGEYESAVRQNYINSSVKDDGSGIIGKPLGREALLKDLKFEFIAYTPEQLIEEANKQFAWCENEMLKASQTMGFGKDWKKALEKVKQSYVAPGQWQEDVNHLANEAVQFIEDRNLITVPPLAKETWRMTMLSAEAQKISPFFLGGEVIQIAYPTAGMEYDDKMMSMRGNNPYFSRATVQHELIPGHHLQIFMMDRYKPYRTLFQTPFWIEGWALYWEFNLWDKQFPRTPEEKIGMLFWRMHRCARIIFSLNYHLEKMTPQQCIDFLVDKVGHERANAAAEVRRSFMGGYGPLYQIAYMTGGLQFYSLRKQLVDSGKMSEKEFHDTILQNNAMPVEIVKAILTGEELKKEASPKWKFLD
ncbi:conserved hypothetical protein [Flavobacterium sp. 9R]|uniref:DUF885 family protein n=1 Tax=Flavobacterium sp. 9R TaxID=2653143 RepID=UPI0012F2BE97|nr:DUF885 family protein [Flavobacterium sp. 9R]VXB00513.1 conserved hypothetical protein [Flavobacterium sp. 9R]